MPSWRDSDKQRYGDDLMNDLTYLASAYLIMIGLLGAWLWKIYQRLENIEKRLSMDENAE